MPSIYHIVPKNLVGTQLIPLNKMKVSNPELYTILASKYQGREKLLERQIPKINCFWNDVLHFSAVCPDVIFTRFEQLGFGDFKGISWFEVPTDVVQKFPTVIYRAPLLPRENFKLTDDDIEIFDSNRWQEPLTLSEAAEEYFLKCQMDGKTPLPFQFTPHILVRGELETRGFKIGSR